MQALAFAKPTCMIVQFTRNLFFFFFKAVLPCETESIKEVLTIFSGAVDIWDFCPNLWGEKKLLNTQSVFSKLRGRCVASCQITFCLDLRAEEVLDKIFFLVKS